MDRFLSKWSNYTCCFSYRYSPFFGQILQNFSFCNLLVCIVKRWAWMSKAIGRIVRDIATNHFLRAAFSNQGSNSSYKHFATGPTDLDCPWVFALQCLTCTKHIWKCGIESLPGNTNWGRRLSTVDLLIMVAYFVAMVNDILIIIMSWSKPVIKIRSTLLSLPLQ